MQLLLEITGLLVILLVILRVSLRRPRAGFALRGGLTALNVVTGALSGAAAAALLLASFGSGAWGPGGGEAPGLDPIAAALRNVLPLAGCALGGIAGYLLLGTIWRRLFRSGTAAARDWLRRLQFALCATALVLLFRGLTG